MVRGATQDDLTGIVAVLGRAFREDPIATYLFPSIRRRGPGLEAFFRVQLANDLLHHGGVYTTDDHAGAAAWAPPGKPMVTGWRAIVAVLPVVPHVLGVATARALRFLSQMEALHAKDPHWYLATLGTEPARQGHGVGGALLAPVLERCDREGLPAQLESSNPRNVPFYYRQGFETIEELHLAKGGPLITVMRREPRV